MIEETVRLYSKAPRVPADVVAPQHEDIHADLERWGRWNREHSLSKGCASAESVYERTRTPSATAPEVDLRSLAIERAVLRMPEQYRKTVRLFYVQLVDEMNLSARDMIPVIICRTFSLRPETFPAWMFVCRAIVLNLLRRQGN